MLSSASPTQSTVYWHGPLKVQPDTLVIRFRMRLVSGGTQNPVRSLPAFVYFGRGARIGCFLYLSADEVALSRGFVRGAHAKASTTDSMHTYRIESWSDSVRVFRDSKPLLEGHTYFAPSFGPEPSISWGCGDTNAYGVSEWQFLEHNAAFSSETDWPRASQPRSISEIRASYRETSWRLMEPPSVPPSRVFFDPFDGGLVPGWEWLRENTGAWHATSSSLVIELERGDLWQDSSRARWGPTNNARNVLLRSVHGEDFVVTTAMETYLAAKINQVRLLIYRDDDNYVRFGIARGVDERLRVGLAHEVQGFGRQVSVPCDTARAQVRILKRAKQAQFQYNLDGRTWILLTQIDDLEFEPTHVGLVAFDGSEEPSASYVFFEYFELQEFAPGSWNENEAEGNAVVAPAR